jgi:hypothetical protein
MPVRLAQTRSTKIVRHTRLNEKARSETIVRRENRPGSSIGALARLFRPRLARRRSCRPSLARVRRFVQMRMVQA